MRPRKAAAVALVMLAAMGFSPLTGTTATAAPVPAFSGHETISRTHLDDGVDRTVDTRNFSVTVSDTQDLRDRQAGTVTWHGAHPTGGTVTDHNSAAAAGQEYPVVLMQCRGVDSTTAPASKQLSPQTCWTQTPDERFQYSQSGFVFPPYRMDRYASTADRAASVNQPTPYPPAGTDCPVPAPAFAHWIPFKALDGTVYPGGRLGCAGLAPEAANSADSLQPGNTTYGVTSTSGDGASKFVIQTTETNASLGCSSTVACTLEIIPIMGLSCDPAGVATGPNLGMPPADRPDPNSDPTIVPLIAAQCEKAGHFAPGQVNGGGELPDLAVSGSMWWAASNWRNRITVPLTFTQSATACDIVTNQSSLYIYGAESLVQATQQWSPHFCLDKSLFTLRHVQTSEPQAKNLLAINNIESAVQGMPPSTPFPQPVVQAPAALSGWAIAYSVDGKDGTPVQNLKLNARLIAKLLSESYRSCSTCLDFTSRDARYNGFAALAENPTDISNDPEFQALNPNLPLAAYHEAASTLEVMSSDSDTMTALTSYINSDPEARAWLNGTPDPWGMLVNPAYKNIALPVSSWPLLDTNLAVLATDSNQCLSRNPVPWLPLIASPVSNPALIALHLQFDISNSQVVCQNNGAQDIEKLVAVGREAEGSRYLFGLVSLADASRYQLGTASLQTQRTGQSTDIFSSPAGRTFVAPTVTSVTAAAKLMVPDDTVGSWTMPYDSFSSARAAKNAYPGTMLLSVDVPTHGLPKADAGQYATLLRFLAGSGQTAGLLAGQLPPGYIPMNSANGIAKFAAYSARAAAAVAAQCGIVPLVSGAPTTGTGSCVAPAANTGAPPPAAGPTSAPAPSSSPPSSSSPPPSPSSSSPAPTVSAVPVAKTVGIRPGAIGVALPVAALVALVALCLLAYNNGLGRRE
jgi:hypothetical protein